MYICERLTIATPSLFALASSYEERQMVAATNGNENYAKSVLQ
jgi:hypothetical protein